MEMRKFIVEIHPDGRVTCCEYEDPHDACKRGWLAGYRRALMHCNDQVETLGASKDRCMSYKLMYQGAVQVRDAVASRYHDYSKL